MPGPGGEPETQKAFALGYLLQKTLHLIKIQPLENRRSAAVVGELRRRLNVFY